MTDEQSAPPQRSVHAKALAINLDPAVYGSFAEIGAGQEVARWFFRVGGAAGTVAQTISAYDKTFSDDTYGAGTRYVSKERLQSMLDREYRLLLDRLGSVRGKDTAFFAFADTAAARNHTGDNFQHAWLGVRFQASPGAEPTDVLLHVNLRSPTADQQQAAVGALGVNLLYGVFYERSSTDAFLCCLGEGLSLDDIEIDVIHATGPGAEALAPPAIGVELVRRKMALATVLDAQGRPIEPSDVLRKRAILVERGRLETLESFHADLLTAARSQLAAEGAPSEHEPVAIVELQADEAGAVDDDAKVLAMARDASALGTVVITSWDTTRDLVTYLRRFTDDPVRLVMGVSGLLQIMRASTPTTPGELLLSLGQLLSTNVRLYAYPMPAGEIIDLFPGASDMLPNGDRNTLVGADELTPHGPFAHLYQYLVSGNWIVGLKARPGNNATTPTA